MPPGIPGGAMCVQRFDDSLNSAIHITYRISLRSSSMPEPRDPLLKVLTIKWYSDITDRQEFGSSGRRSPAGASSPEAGLPKQQRVINKGWKVCPVAVSQAPRLLHLMILPQVHLRKPCYDFYFL